MELEGIGGYHKDYICKQPTINKRINMYINFILFKVYIEKYTNWSNLKVSKDKYETIIDFGKYRLYLSAL